MTFSKLRAQRRLQAVAGLIAGIGMMALATRAPEAAGITPAPLTAAVVRTHVAPREPALDARPLAGAVAAVRQQVARGAFPGGALAVGRGGTLWLMQGIGSTTWKGGEVDAERTVYDLASLTKVVATTTAAMLLYEDGRIDPDAPVSRYLPTYAGEGKGAVTLRHLLTHTSGLPAGTSTRGGSSQERLRSVLATPLKRSPGEKVEYSDVGFVVLYAALEAAAGEPLPQLLERRVYAPLRMDATSYLPGEGCAMCAPTSDAGDPPRGVVHDPTARALGGVAGNAGLFSSAADLSRFAAMLARGGELGGVRVLRASTIERFAERQPGADERALGWETARRDGTGAVGHSMSARAFGHTGFTGTSLWVDPETGAWTVLLTNRTYQPQASNQIQKLRRTVHAFVTEAVAAPLGE